MCTCLNLSLSHFVTQVRAWSEERRERESARALSLSLAQRELVCTCVQLAMGFGNVYQNDSDIAKAVSLTRVLNQNRDGLRDTCILRDRDRERESFIMDYPQRER